MFFGNTHQRGVDLGDRVVKDGFELIIGSVFGNMDVWEIPVEAVIRVSDFSRTDGHEPHLEIFEIPHLGEVIIP